MKHLHSLHGGLDVIGDVHGEYELLVRLLDLLGYQADIASAPDGEFPALRRHPTRRVVFVGDLIDRGPDAPRVLRLVRRMAESGHALVVSGNHEFNAIGYSTPDGQGGWLRAHTAEKTKPHQATLDSFADRATEWADHLAWFRSLPTSLDFGGLRVVHAAWHGPSIEQLAHLTPWTEETLRHSYRDEAALSARELVLNGPEVELPDGAHFFDHAGQHRTAIRVAWWKATDNAPWTDLPFPPGDVLHGLDTDTQAAPPPAFYGPDEPPVVFGHYALPSNAAAVQAHNVACVDFGAGKGGALGAYRWDGEAVLEERKVVRVYADRR